MGNRVSKYGAKKCFASTGEQMDSKRERDRYEELMELQRVGIISELQRQVEFELIPSQQLPKPHLVKGRMKNKESACKYRADFVYKNQKGERVVEDVKSYITAHNAEYIIKRKLMLYVHGIQVEEIM